MKHALSFDIEDWFHIVDIPVLEDISTWDMRPTIVEEKTDMILAMLDEFETKATFFVLGWVANKYPNIAKKVVAAGHELGTHSYWHRKVYELSPDEFHKDLKQSMDVLQDQTGVKVKGFRAPSFSITPGAEWAFDVIKDLGLEYDASLFPARRGHGGYPCQQPAHEIKTTNGYLPELPMSISSFGPAKIPFSGGGYMRALPLWAIKRGFRSFEKKGIPVVVYLHPRDFASDQPVVKMPLHRKFKSYTGLSTTEGKLRALLQAFDFTTCEEIIGL
ncbi:polysaccharide deacetylase family protein [Gracilimonas sp. Q87]|uniref:polysaccharide deacetylase family protein n=1 Tax=Gracilimonas sp. Q87 TaxID=3384766 RepID=UPI0039845670